MASFPSLLNMPPVPTGSVMCEVEGELTAVLPAALDQLLATAYPQLSLRLDTLRQPVNRSAESAFLPNSEKGGLALLTSWRQEGVTGLLSTLTGLEGCALVSWLAGSLLAIWRLSCTLHTSFHPHLRMSTDEMLTTFCSSRGWAEAPLRCLSWHPHTRKLAVAARDDSIRVAGEGAALRPVLRHAGQRDISCLAWRPCCAGELAVGCRAGVVVWRVDPGSLVSRPSTSCVRQLTSQGHSPVTSLAWHPQGKLLASGSPADPNMLIWSVSSEQYTPVRRVSGGGISLVRWAGDGSRLLAATPGRTFRIWNCSNWEADRWSVGGPKGRVNAAAWSADCRHLVFATTDEPVLYCLSFASGSEAAVPIMDLALVSLSGDSETLGGGLVQDIQWDPTGVRLAISFRSSNLVAVLSTETSTTVAISPVGWIRGQEGEEPACLQFQAGGGVEFGCVLTVCWSSGRLQHVPLVCSPGGLPVTTRTDRTSCPPVPELFSSPARS